MSITFAEPKDLDISEPNELLIKEARRKGRRRQIRGSLIVLAALLVTVLLIVGWGGRTGSGKLVTGDTAKSASTREGATATARFFQAQEIDVAGPKELIVGNFKGIFRTTDGGRHWINVTPFVIASQPILLSHLDKIVTASDNQIWLELGGDAQINFIPYSSTGGRTWKLLKLGDARLPTTKIISETISSAGSVPMGLHIRNIFYASPSLAWAQATGPQVGIFTPTYLLRSKDGGATWTAVSK